MLRMLVIGGPAYCGGDGIPQRIIISSQSAIPFRTAREVTHQRSALTPN